MGHSLKSSIFPKVLGVFNGSFETYTGYSGVGDADKKSLSLRVFLRKTDFLRNHLGGGNFF